MSWKGTLYRIFLKFHRAIPGKRLLAYTIRFLKLPVDRFYIDLRFCGKFTVRMGSKRIRLVHYYHTTIENEMFWKGLEGGWERETIRLWKILCADASVVFDVGANTGIYSLLAAALNPEAKVYAFEPSARVFNRLAKNCALNGFQNIHCIEKAVSDHNGNAVFYDVDTDHQYSASLNPDMLGPSDSSKEVTVELVTLDTFINSCKTGGPDLIKIDVEMHEPEVLRGFSESLIAYRPVIIIEVLTGEIGMQIENRLSGLDYLYFLIDELSGPVLKQKITSHNNYNYLLCPKEKREMIPH